MAVDVSQGGANTMTDLPVSLLNPTGPHGSRSAMTCHYRCGFACARRESNTSGSEHIGDVLTRALTHKATPDRAVATTAPLVLDLQSSARSTTS
jgi:hypothetical protein